MHFVQVGKSSFSKVICGSNPFYGKSHFSISRDKEYRDRFSDDEIASVISECVERGVNTIESSANERIFKIYSRIKSLHPNKEFRFVGSTKIDDTSELKRHQQRLDLLIQQRSEICIVHSQYIQRELKGSSINGIEALLDKIHENDLVAGISTHSNRVIEICEKNRYPVDVYMFPLNPLGFAYPGYQGTETPLERIRLIQDTDKPFIVVKVLAAGRVPPNEALSFAYENIKRKDIMSLGFGSVDEVRETLEIVGQIENRATA